eukprot:TRINITY_DN9139_c0_g1_i1.p1 TRINITY_DN9139_c0_g1~~TRINITY_DN9139_c0_g1_i1.p1  ORF type:complete len:662 (+),score=150.30 TRINITY_DN9139_c0_g1_i1:171-2156(+)
MSASDRVYSLEKVGNVRLVQLYADGFDELPTRDKLFAYYLSRAAIASRDISVDQHHHLALEIRDFLEKILVHFMEHPNDAQQAVIQKIHTYLKLFWIGNGPYDSYTSKKYVLECLSDELLTVAKLAGYADNEANEKVKRLEKILFDPAFEPMLTCKTPGKDWIKESAVNFFEKGSDLTLERVEEFEKSKAKFQLNSTLKVVDGEIVEDVWRSGLLEENIPKGRYASDIAAGVKYLEKAIPYASDETQAETIRKLVRHLRTGDLEDFRKYNIHWVSEDTKSNIDFIHGFIEVYLDPIGHKAEFESCVFWSDRELTRSIQKIGNDAQYFENRMPWDDKYKKTDVKPLTANVVNVVLETGGAGPCSAIGINLPNEDAIREKFGSKSVVLNNITDAAEKSSGEVFINEFAFDEAEKEMQHKYGQLADNIHTALHEVLGHASGRTYVDDPQGALPGYYSTLEEARADLVAMWHIWDEKLLELGVIPSHDVARQLYDQEIRNALLIQLRRVPKEDDQLEEDHMKNRQLIANYILRNSDSIKREERVGADGLTRTFFKVVDYEKAKEKVGELLSKIMQIKAHGDFEAAKQLVDTYGFKIDTQLRDQVLARIASLDVTAYNAYVMPEYEPVQNEKGEVVDVKVSYPLDFTRQMLGYSNFTRNEKKLAAV